MVLKKESKYVVFDLEFTHLLNTNTAFEDIHISCASTLLYSETEANVWFDTDINGHICDHLSRQTVDAFFKYLHELALEGFLIVTWGGTAYDFRMLAKEVSVDLKSDVIQMCLDHYDIPFCSGTSIGMMMGLSAAAKALDLNDKSVLSSTIPELWVNDRQLVLNHVANDSYLTLCITNHILNANTLPWITGKGILKTWSPVILQNVRKCLQMPVPKVKFEIQNHVNPKVLSRWIFEL